MFSKISEAIFRHLMLCFALDLTATETSAFTGLSIRTVNAILRIRQRFAQACERESSDLLMGPAVFNPL